MRRPALRHAAVLHQSDRRNRSTRERNTRRFVRQNWRHLVLAAAEDRRTCADHYRRGVQHGRQWSRQKPCPFNAMNDTDDLSFKDHFWLILFSAFAVGSFVAVLVRSSADEPKPSPSHSRYHDASLDTETQPVTTTQAYYEREKATGDK